MNNDVFLTIALLMSIGIFFVAGQPPISGVLNSTGLHWIAHIATYGVMAASYARGLPRVPAPLITVLTAGIGGLHELCEVVRFGISFEFLDLIYDAVGALAGAILVRKFFWIDTSDTQR
jgi:hypothetical protein